MKAKQRIIVGADFKAQIGQRPQNTHPTRSEASDVTSRSVGPHGYGDQNNRGQWLRHWATQQRLIVTNTFFRKTPAKQITYTKDKLHKQWDYVLMNRALFHHCINAEASNRRDLGSDHASLVARLRLPTYMWTRRPRTTSSTPRPPRPPTSKTHQQWGHIDTGDYQRQQQLLLSSAPAPGDPNNLSTFIEHGLTTSTARATAQSKQRNDHTACTDHNDKLHSLILHRRTIPNSDHHRRRQVSQHIWQELRHQKRRSRGQRISDILSRFRAGTRRSHRSRHGEGRHLSRT